MGASTFANRVPLNDSEKKMSRRDAMKASFTRAVRDAKHEHGHGGYTGTLAEKNEVREMGGAATWKEAFSVADSFIEKGDPRIDDKWGPAGAIFVEEGGGGFVFFGWASD